VIENPVVILLISYLLGSIPSSYILGKIFFGLDLRTMGSGNLGATNALRSFGKTTATAVLFMDIAKGWVPIRYFSVTGENQIGSLWILAWGLAAILGHIFSCWVKFRGGKGVATSCGVFLAIAPIAGMISLCSWLVAFLISKKASVGSLVASFVLPIGVYFDPNATDPALLYFSVSLSLLIIWTHRTNLARIMKGIENTSL
jgi:glycerol-3-phosphate acyltransferase PlsY